MKKKGFILTARDYDLNNKYQIEIFVRSNNGVNRIIIKNYYPVFFIEQSVELTKNLQDLVKLRRNTTLKNFTFNIVDALYFSSLNDFYTFRKSAKQQGITLFESDIRPVDRFLMEKRIYGSFEYDEKSDTINSPNIKPTKFHPVFSIASLDIETGQNGELYSISYHLTDSTYQNNKGYSFIIDKSKSLKDISVTTFADIETKIFTFKNEIELLENFINTFQESDPDIIIGWNIINFDINFLFEKCQSLNLNLRLGRNKSKLKLINRNDRLFVTLPGRVIIEGSMSLRAAFYKFDDYSLDFVSLKLLGRGKEISKKSDKEKIAEIERMFKDDKLSLLKYNFIDCLLVSQIFKKTALLDMIIKRIEISGMLFDKIGASVASFDYLMLPAIHQQGYVGIDKDDVVFEGHASGGFVFEPTTGVHENVAVLDFKSLYPSLILTFKIDPLSFLLNDNNTLSTPAGIQMSKTDHILPAFIKSALAKRVVAKKNNSNLSMAIKILMNSFYGVMGTPICRFYKQKLSLAITETGHIILKKSKEYLENNGYEVIYGDTDSLFVKVKSASVDIQKISDAVNIYLKKWLLEEYELESFLELEYEKFYNKLFLAKIRNRDDDIGAKKRYAGFKIKNSGDEIEFVGMEYVRSDWTPIAKEFQYKLYDKIFHNIELKELSDWIIDFIRNLRNGVFNKKMIYEKRLKRLPHNYLKSLPPHVKAAKLLQTKNSGRIRKIRYYMLKSGPTPIEFVKDTELNHKINFEHYLDKQIRPIADTILPVVYDYSLYEILFGKQLKLFDDKMLF